MVRRRCRLLDVPSGWFFAEGAFYGRDEPATIIANVARFRGEAILDGYFVDPGYTIEDWRKPGYFGRPME